MNIRSSAELRNQYKEISELARVLLLMRIRVLCAEQARMNGAKTYTQDELDERFRKRYEDCII